MRLLGIDYGLKRTGFAVGDTDRRIAFPRDVVTGGENEVLDYIGARIRAEHITEIVVGFPRMLSSAEGDMALEVRAFAERVGKRTGLPVHLEDERLSTRAVPKGVVPPGRVDASSAALILQSYLDRC